MANANLRHGSATVRAKARLISLIGDELISDEPVALVELVKNAYDADATNVSVRFEGSTPGRPTQVFIEDNGIGMDLSTVLSAWMEPATTSKRKHSHSPGGRPFQGAKGIGRFATARLAESLLLETKAAHSDQAISLLLDWGVFDDESYLDEITVDYETRTLNNDEHTVLHSTLSGERGVKNSMKN